VLDVATVEMLLQDRPDLAGDPAAEPRMRRLLIDADLK
jgi:hypothetical protein